MHQRNRPIYLRRPKGLIAVAVSLLLPLILLVTSADAAEVRTRDSAPDIRSVEPDLTIPPLSSGEPAPGKRVKITSPEFENTAVYHVLYLPTDWQPGKKYPVIVEYAGNGGYENRWGDVSTGRVEDSKLGYGISGGKGFIWLCLPYVGREGKKNQLIWWGNVTATVNYCIREVSRVCKDWGGDPDALILTGFSRGAIACNYIGLHNDQIAGLWRAFIPYSHYDGVYKWAHTTTDRESPLIRLKRLKGRPTFICHENQGIEDTRRYIESTGVTAPFVYFPLGYRNHNDAWVLRDIPARRAVRSWLAYILVEYPNLDLKP